jgi:hypothetical protein
MQALTDAQHVGGAAVAREHPAASQFTRTRQPRLKSEPIANSAPRRHRIKLAGIPHLSLRLPRPHLSRLLDPDGFPCVHAAGSVDARFPRHIQAAIGAFTATSIRRRV